MPSIISLDDKCFRTIIDKAKSLNIEIIDMRNNGNDVCLKEMISCMEQRLRK